jgi:hypothetical protein
MEIIQNQEHEADISAISAKIFQVKEKINKLPLSLQTLVNFEYSLIEDFFKDKYLRSVARGKKIRGKKVGGTKFFDD